MNKYKRLRAPITYQGGKYKELPKIFENEPDTFDTFVDVFGGAGVCALNYGNRGFTVHYNDLYEPLFLLFNTLQNKTKCEELEKRLRNIKPSPEIHQDLTDGKYGILERLFYISRCTLNCDPHLKTGSKLTPRFKAGTTDYKDILPPSVCLCNYYDNVKNWKITQCDFLEVLKEHQHNENAFLYCDPPYVSKTTKQYTTTFTAVQLLSIYDFMKSPDTKCKIMLNVDYTGWTRETFADLVKLSYPVVYGCKTVMDIYRKYHLIICNY